MVIYFYRISTLKQINFIGISAMKIINRYFYVILITTLVVITVFCCSCTSAENVKTETTTHKETSTETAVTTNTIETISVTEPSLPSEEYAARLLLSYGYNPSDLRRKHTFNSDKLNSNSNKDYVLDRMCNSIDYLTTLLASYTKKENQKTTLVTYAIDRRIGKAKEILYNVSESETMCTPLNYVCVDGNYHLKLLFKDEAKDKYTFNYKSSLDSNAIDSVIQFISKPLADELSPVTDEPVINSSTTDKDDIEKYLDAPKRIIYKDGKPNAYLWRNNSLGLITAEEHYLPQYFALDTLLDYSAWKIDNLESDGSNEIICISGTYKEYGQLNRTFNLRIDKRTGVIVSKQIYNASGNLVEEWNNLQFIVDGEIDENIFDSLNP